MLPWLPRGPRASLAALPPLGHRGLSGGAHLEADGNIQSKGTMGFVVSPLLLWPATSCVFTTGMRSSEAQTDAGAVEKCEGMFEKS